MAPMDMTTAAVATVLSSSMTAATTASAASAGSEIGTAAMDMGGPTSCKSSMFWNWYTLGACFISQTWHITSPGMFVGSCIGVIVLVLFLEFLRRLQREYDRHILLHCQEQARIESKMTSHYNSAASKMDSNSNSGYEDPPHSAVPLLGDCEMSLPPKRPAQLPSAFQQAIRASIYTIQFAVAYMVMLLAMYYNGYILGCIVIAAWLGYFIFSRDTFESARRASSDNAACCA